jgi:hypothetical protein
MRLFALSVLALAACGGGLSTDLEGVYMTATWTENATACDVEGPSKLAGQTDKALFVEVAEFLGVEFVNAVQCTDIADCQSKAAEDTIFLGGFAFEGGSDSAGWTGATVFASGDQTTCTGSVVDYVMTDAGGGLRIESRERDSKPFAVASDGFCDTDDARVAAEGQPCVRFEVITATFASDL